MKRFDPGHRERQKTFIDDEMGQMLAFKGWYCDSTHRYPMTDAVQPLIIRSATSARNRPDKDPKAGSCSNITCWRMAAILWIWRRFLCGDLVEVHGPPSAAFRRP